MVVNKKTWYAHYHKGRDGKNYGFSNAQYRIHQEGRNRGRKNCIDFWIHDRVNENWNKRTRDWEWLINTFPDMPGWEGNWKQRLIEDKAKENPK